MEPQITNWTEQLKQPPFSKIHFTEEMKYNVMQKTKKKNRPRRFAVASSVVALLAIALWVGFAWPNGGLFFHNSPHIASSAENDWEPTGFFTVNGQQLLGIPGKVGIMKLSGSPGEPFLTSRQGIHYQIYFWGNAEKFKGKYKITGTNKNTKEVIPLYEWPIQVGKDENGADAASGGKFGLDKPGLWRLDIYVNNEYFDHVVVDVK